MKLSVGSKGPVTPEIITERRMEKGDKHTAV